MRTFTSSNLAQTTTSTKATTRQQPQSTDNYWVCITVEADSAIAANQISSGLDFSLSLSLSQKLRYNTGLI